MKKNNQPQRRPMYRDESKFVVYMTRDAHTRFCTTCDKNLFRKVTSSNIQYDPKMRHVTSHGYCFMIEVPTEYKDRLMSMIKSDKKINAGTTTNPKKKHSHSSQKPKNISSSRPAQKQPLNLRPVSGKPAQATTAKPITQKTTTPIKTPLTLGQSTPKPTITLEYAINDLTPYMVEKILGVKWSMLCGKHFFYLFNKPLAEDYITSRELIRMRDKFDKHPMFQGRKMAFVTYGIAYYNGNKDYIKEPMLHDFEYGPTEPYSDKYGTFISYNPKTKQFEKYPRGWIRLENDILEFGYDLTKTLSDKTEEILSAYSDQKQKTR